MAEGKIKLMAVGDISLETKNNINPFTNVKEVFGDKDVLFGNLETVLSSQGKEAEKAVQLYTSPDKVKYLKESGFDVLNLANNHIFDLGLDGFNETLDVLSSSNITFVGVDSHKYTQRHAVVERENVKLGFLGYYTGGFEDKHRGFGINKISKPQIVRDIKSLKANCDVIVVSLHWGIESVFYPCPEQIKLARKLIDTGASVVLGHGPHVVQGVERYKHGLIAYSLGNFQFGFDHEKHDTLVTNKVRETVILSLDISKQGVEGYDVVPVEIDSKYAPHIMAEEEKEDYLDFIAKISKTVSEGRVTKRWWFEQIASTYLLTNIYSWFRRIERYGFRHLLQCIRWLICPFVIRCYIGLLSKSLKTKTMLWSQASSKCERGLHCDSGRCNDFSSRHHTSLQEHKDRQGCPTYSRIPGPYHPSSCSLERERAQNA